MELANSDPVSMLASWFASRGRVGFGVRYSCRMHQQKTVQIYVKLENEGTDVCRPVEAYQVSEDEYQILSERTDEPEVWQFATTEVVSCRKRVMDGETFLVA